MTILTAVHYIFGFSLDEIGDIVTIAGFVTAILAGINHILQKRVTNPINGLQNELQKHSRTSSIRLVKIHDKIKDHEDRLQTLEKHDKLK